MARHRGTRRASGQHLGKQLLRGMRLSNKKPQVRERAPQSCSTRGQHAPALHQAVLADGQARCQRRPRRGHRRDVLQTPAGSDRVGPPRREASPAAGQRKGGHDVHGRLQHGPWPAEHAGADRARRQRHIGERLGHDDDAPAARGQSGQRAEPLQRRTSVDPSLGHDQHPRQRGTTGRDKRSKMIHADCAG